MTKCNLCVENDRFWGSLVPQNFQGNTSVYTDLFNCIIENILCLKISNTMHILDFAKTLFLKLIHHTVHRTSLYSISFRLPRRYRSSYHHEMAEIVPSKASVSSRKKKNSPSFWKPTQTTEYE